MVCPFPHRASLLHLPLQASQKWALRWAPEGRAGRPAEDHLSTSSPGKQVRCGNACSEKDVRAARKWASWTTWYELTELCHFIRFMFIHDLKLISCNQQSPKMYTRGCIRVLDRSYCEFALVLHTTVPQRVYNAKSTSESPQWDVVRLLLPHAVNVASAGVPR